MVINHFLELQSPTIRNPIILISSDSLKIETLLLLVDGRYLHSMLQESYRKSSGEDTLSIKLTFYNSDLNLFDSYKGFLSLYVIKQIETGVNTWVGKFRNTNMARVLT